MHLQLLSQATSDKDSIKNNNAMQELYKQKTNELPV